MRRLKGQRGQTLIEFILLLAMLVGITYSFHQVFGSQVGNIWLRIATQINDNPTVKLEIQ
jgi:hypothetical protein